MRGALEGAVEGIGDGEKGGWPFGNEHLLPRGTLREPPRNIKRASYIFITKCNGEPNDELITRIRKHNRTAEIIECTHKPQYLENVVTRERLSLEELKGKYIGSICGIAVPESFEDGLKKLGAKIETRRRFTDHHRYTEKELLDFINRCINRDVDMIVTTEKDFVRFPHLPRMDVPIYFMRVEIEILSNEETWTECVNRICKPRGRSSQRGGFSRSLAPSWKALLRERPRSTINAPSVG